MSGQAPRGVGDLLGLSIVKGAGLEHRSPYALRHTFATFSIAAGVPLFELSRFMGTSVSQIEKTYGHLLPDSLERAKTALDLFLGRSEKLESAR
jgi:integrase